MALKTIPTKISTLIAGLLLASHGTVALSEPVKIKTEHPRLYATKDDFDRIKNTLMPALLSFSAKKGTLKLTVVPTPRQPGDAGDADIFGAFGGTGDRLVIRHTDLTTDPVQTRVKLQMGLLNSAGTWVRDATGNIVIGAEVAPAKAVEVEFSYEIDKTATLRIGETTRPVSLAGTGWTPINQIFDFLGHRQDRITNMTLKLTDDKGKETTWQGVPDLDALASWRGLVSTATLEATTITGCPVTGTPAAEPKVCDTTNGGRDNMTETAKRLAMAYRMTGRSTFLEAAMKHIALMDKVALTSGGEWSMAGRVGALGIYYDWLYASHTDATRSALAKLIKKTIGADRADSNDDLIASICGAQQLATAGAFDCAAKPVFSGWSRPSNLPSTAQYYLGGHTASAVTGSVLGLIAIADHPDYADVGPMIDTIYDHFALGFLPARDFQGPDGGTYAAFSYGASAGETVDRLVMWQRAIASDSQKPAPKLNSASRLLYPFLYALRSDKMFPARGDNYAHYVSYQDIGSMALGAVTQGGDAAALDFYERHVVSARSRTSYWNIWDRLLYPHAVKPQATALPLSAYFSRAGNVLMRDTWDYATATLLEFKSTSFINENHHHLDQNSFSLYYKAPLLLDSGQYDNYATGHWWNYYQRTVAHNAIVVHDSKEGFGGWSNDGGQWYDDRQAYPTIEEITPAKDGAPDGPNVLKGVTAFHDGGTYSYVSADATPAYKRGKLALRGGALRSIVYLRQPASRDGTVVPPTILVFDRVQANPNVATPVLAATSLLHTVGKPVSNGTLGGGTTGRFNYSFGTAKPLFTVRNGDGMVTVQPLLPANPSIVLSGGKDEGSSCKQITYVTESNKLVQQPLTWNGDCRFLVQENNADTWANYPPSNAKEITGDVGNWRLEITPATNVANTVPQYFLNVLHVAPNDKGGSVKSDNLATLLAGSANAVAVRMADGTAVVFNDEASQATSLYWQPAGTLVKTIVVGLVSNAYYKRDGAVDRVTLTKVDASRSAENGVMQASDQGIVEL